MLISCTLWSVKGKSLLHILLPPLLFLLFANLTVIFQTLYITYFYLWILCGKKKHQMITKSVYTRACLNSNLCDFSVNLKAIIESGKRFTKLPNYLKMPLTHRNSRYRKKWGSSGAKICYKCCSYWVWQPLIRITFSCCYQREKKSFHAQDRNEGFEARGASPLLDLSFAFFFKGAECLWHTPMRALHSRTSCHRLFYAITYCCGDISSRARFIQVSTRLWTPPLSPFLSLLPSLHLCFSISFSLMKQK